MPFIIVHTEYNITIIFTTFYITVFLHVSAIKLMSLSVMINLWIFMQCVHELEVCKNYAAVFKPVIL
jgi:hypothetical protein